MEVLLAAADDVAHAAAPGIGQRIHDIVIA